MNQLYKNVSVPEFKVSSDGAQAFIIGMYFCSEDRASDFYCFALTHSELSL